MYRYFVFRNSFVFRCCATFYYEFQSKYINYISYLKWALNAINLKHWRCIRETNNLLCGSTLGYTAYGGQPSEFWPVDIETRQGGSTSEILLFFYINEVVATIMNLIIGFSLRYSQNEQFMLCISYFAFWCDMHSISLTWCSEVMSKRRSTQI